ncbi:MAG: NAD-dependent epimerase [Verrucomicrobia bacterium]|nr:NAD-dependent epimerase [Verrucomicrobiota bacterium]MBU1734885.1 NAD-dependent epimerase [Verrucomicrobiota bacterium]
MKILVTGAAGFIGFHVARRLLERGDHVVGWDNINAYYDVNLKASRLKLLGGDAKFTFQKMDLAQPELVATAFKEACPERVIHLAAQVGVRYSVKYPQVYINSNIHGFINILEACRYQQVQHLVYASSSSVYGMNKVSPFSIHHNVDHPISLYAATKKANELMAHSYSHLYGLPTTGLRLFTVYGPWGRPDMALFIFTRAILEGRPIQIFNYGRMQRDFTYIDDIVEGIVRVLDRPPRANADWDQIKADPGTSSAPYRVYNIGNHKPEQLLRLIEILESYLGKQAKKELLPMQAGDVEATCADVADLVRDTGFQPGTPLEAGIKKFVDWYREYYQTR